MNYKFLFFLLVTLCFKNANGQALNYSEKAIESQIDQLVKAYMDLDLFSGVVLVAKEGNPMYHKAFGYANRSKNIKNAVDTKFDIGSMNKTFTKVVVLNLAEEGKIDLHANLGQYLQGIDDLAAEKATVSDLLNHSSGYGDYLNYEYDQLPSDQKTFEKTLELVKSSQLEFEPGTDQMYSNSGYVLLGGIIEAVTGASYFENIEKYIIGPLRLKATEIHPAQASDKTVIGYYRNIEGELMTNEHLIEYPKPDGGFRATTTDIMKFYTDYLYGEVMLTAEAKEKDEFFQAIKPYSETGAAIPHAGGYPGANTVKYEILRDQISIIVFANMDEPVAEDLGAGILALLRGQKPEQPSYPAVPNVYRHYREKGIEYIEEHFQELIQNFHPTDPKGIILNQIGYFLLMEKEEVENAIEIFALNTRLFGAEDANVWDSLGEALYMDNRKKEALEAYQKALALDPEFPSALKMVKKITSE